MEGRQAFLVIAGVRGQAVNLMGSFSNAEAAQECASFLESQYQERHWTTIFPVTWPTEVLSTYVVHWDKLFDSAQVWCDEFLQEQISKLNF